MCACAFTAGLSTSDGANTSSLARWRHLQDAVLLLSSINLTGGVQRRRTIQDQLQMREYFAENDLISVRAQMGGIVVLAAQ